MPRCAPAASPAEQASIRSAVLEAGPERAGAIPEVLVGTALCALASGAPRRASHGDRGSRTRRHEAGRRGDARGAHRHLDHRRAPRSDARQLSPSCRGHPVSCCQQCLLALISGSGPVSSSCATPLGGRLSIEAGPCGSQRRVFRCCPDLYVGNRSRPGPTPKAEMAGLARLDKRRSVGDLVAAVDWLEAALRIRGERVGIRSFRWVHCFPSICAPSARLWPLPCSPRSPPGRSRPTTARRHCGSTWPQRLNGPIIESRSGRP